MKNISCGSQLEPSKYRHHLVPGSLYQNVHRGTLRPIAIDYTLPNCTGRRSTSTSSITHTHHSLWQERHHLRTPISCIGVDRKPSTSKGKACSIALAIASFIVLVIVLAIAGLALYMGISNTESPASATITFSCSAKVLRGDRFIGALDEKASKYKKQIETLYQRSSLGPALLSASVDRFGKDGVTIYFRLAFNRRKLVEDLTNIEKAIKDIFLSDSYAKKPIFRNVRFDPRSIMIRQVQKTASGPTVPPKNSLKPNKMGVVLKSTKNSTAFSSVTSTAKPIIKDEPEFNEEDLPVIQGSFMISKTEADITQKKTGTSETKGRPDKPTNAPTRKTTFKESSVTSAPYKIPGIKGKITKVISPTAPSSTTPLTTQSTTTTPTTSKTTAKFKGSPQISDEEPWIPILPNLPTFTKGEPPANENIPVYTSFTNPGFSFQGEESERLGSTSLKSHPIPVNKIPFTHPYVDASTEPTKVHVVEITTNSVTPETEPNSSFIQIETINHEAEPSVEDDVAQEYPMKNISTIFYDLATSLEKSNMSEIEEDMIYQPEFKEPSGQGHVEVVEVDVEELLTHTTKIPLVTLLPVRSNSGVGRPFNRHRLGDSNNLSVENRSFPSQLTKQNLDVHVKQKNKTRAVPSPTNVSSADNYRITGILNFAKEGFDEAESAGHSDIVRFPKMDQVPEDQSGYSVTFSSSVLSNGEKTTKHSNLLTAAQIKQLSEISNIHDNETLFEAEPVISTKALSSSYSTNHNGFKILTKTFNKTPDNLKNNDTNSYTKLGFNIKHLEIDCEDSGFKCGDGKCLPESAKCNQLIDCADGSDEENCNCADYLKSQLLTNKMCDGVVDCWDFSDENQCTWCKPGQYVCSNSKVCIDQEKICDGIKDCPQGDDERQCVTIASDSKTANEFPYYSNGYLMVRKHGVWGKLCIDNFDNVVSKSHISWEINDLGKAICKSMTYQKLRSIESSEDVAEATDKQYFELAYTMENKNKSSLLFKESSCPTRKVVKVTCEALECGARPQAVKHVARVVGGGNAGLGSWPWQVALYKDGEFQCGATLVSNRWLVSAGHCFYGSPNEHWVARLGALRRGTTLPSPYEQLRVISRIIVHPGYLDFGFINDISLLQMTYPVVFSDYVRPVCLPPPGQVLENGHLCTVIGWGQLFEVGRIFPDTLQEVQIPVISTPECRKRTLFLPLYKITDDMFCAGFDRGGRDACLGDSGGPLMCPEPNGRWTLQGITSNGYGCARANRPGVYTKVANYVGWINSYVYGDDSRVENVTKIVTSCTGHRCPLGECLPESRLCNGFIECSDGSDEKNCKKS
uniref:Peptidase S1 domain-containing protein n=1 Tax=Dendroctonus ponderosae TaxID=77166 RepID=A0AAR5PWV3_DENPD